MWTSNRGIKFWRGPWNEAGEDQVLYIPGTNTNMGASGGERERNGNATLQQLGQLRVGRLDPHCQSPHRLEGLRPSCSSDP